MKDEVAKLVKHTGLYGLGTIATKALGFIMIPVYTRFLMPRDYGILELLDLIVFFTGNIAALGINNAVFRFYAAYESEQDKKEVIATALLYTAGASMLCGLLLAGLAPTLAQLVLGQASLAPFVRVVAATFFFSNLTEVPLAYWRAQERTRLFVIVSLVRTLVGATLLIGALAVLRLGVLGVLYANCLTSAIFGLTLAGLIFSQVPKKIVWHKLEEMLRYGGPLVLSALASFVLVFSDRFFLRRFGSLTDVGVYALGYKFAMIVSILVNAPFSMTWQWQQFDLAKKENARDLYARIQFYQLLVSLMVALAVSVLARDALRLLTPPSYWGAARVVPLIALCYVFENIRTVFLSGVLVQKLTHRLLPIAGLIAVTNLGLNYILIPRYLMMGAAVATLLSYGIYLVLAYYVAQRAYFVEYGFGRSAAALGAAALLCLASLSLKLSVIPSISANLSLLALFILLAIALLKRDERAMFLQMALGFGQWVGKVWVREGGARSSSA